jgi:hypothetical protein
MQDTLQATHGVEALRLPGGADFDDFNLKAIIEGEQIGFDVGLELVFAGLAGEDDDQREPQALGDRTNHLPGDVLLVAAQDDFLGAYLTEQEDVTQGVPALPVEISQGLLPFEPAWRGSGRDDEADELLVMVGAALQAGGGSFEVDLRLDIDEGLQEGFVNGGFAPEEELLGAQEGSQALNTDGEGAQVADGKLGVFDLAGLGKEAADRDAQHGDLISQAFCQAGIQVIQLQGGHGCGVEAMLEGVVIARLSAATAPGLHLTIHRTPPIPYRER